MATVQKFEELQVWQLARELSQKIYPLTFLDPITKDLRFKDQIRGACGSIMDNIISLKVLSEAANGNLSILSPLQKAK